MKIYIQIKLFNYFRYLNYFVLFIIIYALMFSYLYNTYVLLSIHILFIDVWLLI